MPPKLRKVLPIAGAAVAALLLMVLVSTASASTSLSRAAIARLPRAIVDLAKKWAKKRGLPPQWILATILVESGGDPNRVGDFHIDPRGASIGLMQVNTVAHRDRLAAAGITREMLFDPNTNLEWGTKILREVFDKLRRELGITPSDTLVRLAYKGVDVVGSVKAGRDPRVAYAAPVARWYEALARTRALV